MPALLNRSLLSRIRAGLKTPHLVALTLVLLLGLSGCGRKPTNVDAPEGSITRTYPPVENVIKP